MGGKRLSKGNSIFFHIAVGLGVMGLLSGCQGLSSTSPKEPAEYMADFQRLEHVQSLIGKEEFKSALTQNAILESHYDYSGSRSGDYDRVIRVSARMNTALLKKIIQDEKTILTLSKKIGQQDLTVKKLESEKDALSQKLQDLVTALKTVEQLETENKALRRQIKDFKKIDLEGHEMKVDM